MISVATVRQEIPATASLDDPKLQAMITRAVEFMQSQTRRYFGPPLTMTDYLNGSGGRVLRLPEPAAINDSDADIDLVEERPYPGGAATEITGDAYQLRHIDHTDVLVRLGGLTWLAGYEYAVTYERGYLEDEGPKDIEDIILELLKFKLKFTDKVGMRSESLGGYSYTRFGDSDLDAVDGARATIDAWRRVVFA